MVKAVTTYAMAWSLSEITDAKVVYIMDSDGQEITHSDPMQEIYTNIKPNTPVFVKTSRIHSDCAEIQVIPDEKAAHFRAIMEY